VNVQDAMPEPPPIDLDQVIDTARERLRPGLILSASAIGVLLLGLVLSGLITSALLGVLITGGLNQGGSNPPPPTAMAGMQIGMLLVMVLLSLIVACVHGLTLWMASRLRSREWIVGAGVASIAGPLLQFFLLLCTQGSCGCLVAPVALGLGIAGGVMLLIASQQPQVKAGVEARSRLDEGWVSG